MKENEIKERIERKMEEREKNERKYISEKTVLN